VDILVSKVAFKWVNLCRYDTVRRAKVNLVDLAVGLYNLNAVDPGA
jgi:hypothetical protein